jgi:hypothetical protein
MMNLKKILIGAALVTGLLLALPFLIPMQAYLHQAEKIASEKLGQPVSISCTFILFAHSARGCRRYRGWKKSRT